MSFSDCAVLLESNPGAAGSCESWPELGSAALAAGTATCLWPAGCHSPGCLPASPFSPACRFVKPLEPYTEKVSN